MESDDNYQSFSPPSEPSPSLHFRKLKRLKKKSIKVSADPHPAKSAVDELISLPAVDFAKLEVLESSKHLGSDDSEEQLQSQSTSDSIHIENELSSGFGGLNFDEGRRETKRALEFDDDEFGGEEENLDGKIADLRIEKVEKKETGEGRSNDDKEKKKRFKSILSLPPVDFAKLEALEYSKTLGFDESNESLQSPSPSEGSNDENKSNSEGVRDEPRQTRRVLEFDETADEFGGERVDHIEENEEKTEELRAKKSEKKRVSEGGLNEQEKKKKVKSVSAETKQKLSNKMREEKERRSHLQQLHVESQRLLRETRGAGFKPVPVVQKPISSILEKIRQRKLEVSKKISHLNSSVSIAESNEPLREVMMDVDSEKVSSQGETTDKLTDTVQVEVNTVANPDDLDSSLDASMDEVKESWTQSSHQIVKSEMALDEEATPAFRAPVDDTQDLFGDSQTSDIKDDQPNDQHGSPMEEVLAPSLRTMNLKFDSAPPDDEGFSDEEENDKENLDPRMHKPGDECSPKGDPVKAFVDDEAEEEDDSDNDLFRFQENEEDEGNEDTEELNDLIVTGYKEKPVDNERRNELHQKWLEQQDAAGTDNLLQRLKCGPKVRDTTLLDVEDESDEDEEEFSDDEKDVAPAKTARINTRKAKQMITQMFADKDDAFLSSDDEETEKRLVKQRVLEKAGDQAALVSPAEDESSREVFGLIKKLNDAPVTKKKAKASTFFDTLLTGGNSNSSSKSSFLGRVSNHSLPSSNKQKSSMVRSFIFGRDDSNSRNSVSISEDSSDAVSRENKRTRNVTAKFSGSQAKSMTQSTMIAAETASGTSLFEILKRSSMQSNSCNKDTMVGLTQTAFSAFKIPKKPIRIEGRTKY